MPTDTKPQAKGKEKPKGKGGKGFVAFLQRKEMGLPIWAWALILAVAIFFLYKRGAGGSPKSASASTPQDTTQPVDSGAGAGDFSGGGGGGSPATDTSGDLSNFGQSPFGSGFVLPYGYGSDQGFPDSFDNLPLGTNPSATTGVGGVGPLNWGEQHFTSRAQFESWLTARGGSIAGFRVSHPAAYAHYLALPSGKKAVKAQKKTTTRALGLSRSSTRTPATKAAKKTATGVSGATPHKTTVRTIAKAPLSGAAHTLTQANPTGRTSALHPSALVGGESTHHVSAPKVSTPTKGPAKSTSKPKPVARPVVQKKANATPPRKARK